MHNGSDGLFCYRTHTGPHYNNEVQKSCQDFLNFNNNWTWVIFFAGTLHTCSLISNVLVEGRAQLVGIFKREADLLDVLRHFFNDAWFTKRWDVGAVDRDRTWGALSDSKDSNTHSDNNNLILHLSAAMNWKYELMEIRRIIRY